MAHRALLEDLLRMGLHACGRRGAVQGIPVAGGRLALHTGSSVWAEHQVTGDHSRVSIVPTHAAARPLADAPHCTF